MPGQVLSIEAAGPKFGIETSTRPVRNDEEIEQAIKASASEANAGRLVLLDSLTLAYRELIIGLVSETFSPPRKSRFPATETAVGRDSVRMGSYCAGSPSIWCWRDHSAGRSARRTTPGNGDRKRQRLGSPVTPKEVRACGAAETIPWRFEPRL